MNLVARQDFARRLIGQTVHVYKLGGVRPEDDPNTDLYLPLPEYGICLMTFKPKEYSHGEAMSRQWNRDHPNDRLPGQENASISKIPDSPTTRHCIPITGNDMLDAIHKAGNV
jgi:hypothetical protein